MSRDRQVVSEPMKHLYHRLGTVEAVTTDHSKVIADHEQRLRGLEHLTAKVVGGAIVGSALGGWILSNLSSCAG